MTDQRSSQVVVENLALTDPNARPSQAVLESLGLAVRSARVTQGVAEVLGSTPVHMRATQVVVEVLLVNLEADVLPIYPDQSALPGLAYNVKWAPVFFNMPTATAASGADIDLALSQYPLHDFELTYEFLRDGCLQNTGSSEFKRMMGFFLRVGGTAGRFLFRNPDDCTVVAQAIGTTDGVASVFGPIVRTFGVGEDSGTEPVGLVDPTVPCKVYLNGVLQDTSTYQILNATPGSQQVKFLTTPSGGKAITMDFGYLYYCKFPDNSYTFEKFMNRLWLLNKINIHTCRPGA